MTLTVRAALTQASQEAGLSTEGTRELMYVLQSLEGWSSADILLHRDDAVSPELSDRLTECAHQLARHVPAEYLTGNADFDGVTVAVKEGVLVPRPETEWLVGRVVDVLARRRGLPSPRVLELCSGLVPWHLPWPSAYPRHRSSVWRLTRLLSPVLGNLRPASESWTA